MLRRQAVEQLQSRDIDFADIGAIDHEGVVDLAPVTAAVALHMPDDVARRAWQVAMKEGRLPAPRWRARMLPKLGASTSSTLPHSGETERTGLEVAAVEVAVRADQGKAIAVSGTAGQEFAETDAGIGRWRWCRRVRDTRGERSAWDRRYRGGWAPPPARGAGPSGQGGSARRRPRQSGWPRGAANAALTKVRRAIPWHERARKLPTSSMAGSSGAARQAGLT